MFTVRYFYREKENDNEYSMLRDKDIAQIKIKFSFF